MTPIDGPLRLHFVAQVTVGQLMRFWTSEFSPQTLQASSKADGEESHLVMLWSCAGGTAGLSAALSRGRRQRFAL